MPDPHRIPLKTQVRLADLPTDGKEFHDDRDAAEEEFERLRDELVEWQRRLYAEGRRKLLIVLQAMDAGGKDGSIRHLFKGVNPQGVRVTSFKKPSEVELAHDFLWRVHRAVPATGMIGVFNRSHYEDVLVVRVDKIVAESVWRPRYEHINNFERLLVDSGTVILKFYLHISQDEQRERFEKRINRPEKQWKFDPDDLRKRRQWDDYMAAFEEMLTRTNTETAPWNVIPADRKWYRNLALARVVVDALKCMNPEYPPADEDLDKYLLD